MRFGRFPLALIVVALLGTSLAAAQGQPERLGKVHFPVSCTPAAQEQFDRAVTLLHSFWYSEALKAFSAVTQTDPSCAMGHWGAAMSLWYPLWEPPSEAALKQGWAAVEKAKAAGAKTDRERDYIAAIETFYKDTDKLDHRTRALAYEQAMERLSLRFPDDREAAVFYALALNATALPTDKTYAKPVKAGEILEKVFAEQPDHPGVAHYLIHSYDYPPLATRGLAAARRYATIAPSAPHALHMPSHIFVRLGLWQETIDSNRLSAAAAKGHGSAFEQFHALDYMVYGYLQRGQDREAKRVLDERNTVGPVERENLPLAYGLAAIPARYAVERRAWAEAAALEPRSSRYPYAETLTSFARALGAARSGNAAGARREAEKIESIRDALTQAKQTYWASQAEIARRAAAAWAARAEGKNEEALALLRSAADLEDATEKHPVTPAPILPAREQLGELLLEVGQPGAALPEFEVSLKREPSRFHSFAGAARAAELSGDRAKARAHYEKLLSLAERADAERPELAQAKAFLGKP